MEKTKSFRDLVVWQKSMALVLLIYKQTSHFPQSELYALSNQMRRAAVAIPSNIAEGYIRKHTKEYAQFVSIAFASGAELETQLEISQQLGYIKQTEYQEALSLLEEVLKMLNKLSQVLKTNS